MTKMQTFDLTPFHRTAVGLDRVLDRMVSNFESNITPNYPPFNIVRYDDDNYQIELAVAGFGKDDISIAVKEGMLTVEGNKTTTDTREYLHQGIGYRKFTRSFILADYVEVEDAEMADGILQIKCKRHIPESMKPKLIEIK